MKGPTSSVEAGEDEEDGEEDEEEDWEEEGKDAVEEDESKVFVAIEEIIPGKPIETTGRSKFRMRIFRESMRSKRG